MTPPPSSRRLGPPSPSLSPPGPQFSLFSSPSSPPPACAGPGPLSSNLEDDSGFESLVTNVSDSGDHFLRLNKRNSLTWTGSLCSRLVSSPANRDSGVYLPEPSTLYQNINTANPPPSPAPASTLRRVFCHSILTKDLSSS